MDYTPTRQRPARELLEMNIALPYFAHDLDAPVIYHLTVTIIDPDVLDTLTIAARKHATPAQIALAWLHHKGDDIVPIPGTKNVRYLEENAAAVDIRLSAEDLAVLDGAVTPDKVAGGGKWSTAPVEHDR